MRLLHEYETTVTDGATCAITDIMGASTNLTNPTASRLLERKLRLTRDALDVILKNPSVNHEELIREVLGLTVPK